MQQTNVPLDFISAKRVQVGDEINVNVTVRNTHPVRTVTRVYRVMSVDRINEIAGCTFLHETEVRV